MRGLQERIPRIKCDRTVFKDAFCKTKELANEMFVPYELPKTPITRKGQVSSYESGDEIQTDAKRRFRIEFFLLHWTQQL
jgi:hypothetical protein